MAVPGESSEQGGSSAEKRFELGALPTFESLTIFDDTRELLYGSVHSLEVDADNIDEVSAAMGEYIMDAACAFGEVGANIATSHGDDEAQSILATIWNDDDEQRMILFGNLADCSDCFTGGNYDTIFNNIRIAYLQAEHADQELADTLEGAYAYVASQEVGSLIGHLAKGNLDYHEENKIMTDEPEPDTTKVVSTEVTIPLAAEKVIGYSLDVVKIALGAGIALWMHRKYFGRG